MLPTVAPRAVLQSSNPILRQQGQGGSKQSYQQTARPEDRLTFPALCP